MQVILSIIVMVILIVVLIVVTIIDSRKERLRRIRVESERFGVTEEEFVSKYARLSQDELELVYNRKLYNDWVEMERNDVMPIVSHVPLRLLEGECALYYDENVVLSENQVLGSVGSASGFGGTVGGVVAGAGESQSRVVSGVAESDVGELCVTNRRFMFVGRRENRIYDLSSVVKSSGDNQSLELVIEGCAKNLFFTSLSNANIADAVVRKGCGLEFKAYQDIVAGTRAA